MKEMLMRPDVVLLLVVMLMGYTILFAVYKKHNDPTIIWYIPYTILILLWYCAYSTRP